MASNIACPAARPCGGVESADRCEQKTGLERLLQNTIRAHASDFGFINRLDGARGQKHRGAPVVLYVVTQLIAGNLGHGDIGNNQVGMGILQAQHRYQTVADRNDFMSLVAKNPLAHALSMRTIVGEQDPAHGLTARG